MKPKVNIKGQLKNYMHWPLRLTILLIVLNIVAYYFDTRTGVFFTIFTILYVVIVWLSYLLNRPVILNELIDFASQYGSVQKKLIEEFEVPYALIDNNGKILWMNQNFMKITGKGKDYHKSISGIFPSITREIVQKEDESLDKDITWKKRYYRVNMKKIYLNSVMKKNEIVTNEEEQFLTAVYLFDETDLHYYIVENQEQELVCGLVYIDNYDEALDSIEEVKRSLLVALVDRKVNKYFAERDSIVKKLEKDKYFIVFQHKYLNEFMEDKFHIIEDVKTIKIGNEMAVTLSIGIGYSGTGYNQNYEYSRMAMDLALGRGGDQVVLKEGENISYYGGKTGQVEKMTRVKARVKAHALREIIESKEQVIIMGHKICDVDSFGAAVGIHCAARVLGKRTHIVIDELTTSVRPLKEYLMEGGKHAPDLFIRSERALELVDDNAVVMVVDTNKPCMTECQELLKRTKTIVVFDHHRQGSEIIENAVLSYIETYASSTCEMVAEVLQYFSEKIHLEPEEADCIYAGILIDTNNFMSKTGVRTFEAAAYLRRCGAEVTRVRKMLRYDMKAYKARAEAVQHAEVYRGVFAISVCPNRDLESPTIAGAQAANELLNIVGIKASFVLTEYHGKIFISSRSIDEINVQLVMERMGGGGHLNIAGAQLENCTMEEGKKQVQKTLDLMIEEGDIEI